MTLDELAAQLLPTFPPSVQKDIKTSLKVLARALNHADPQSCPLTDCLQPLPMLYRLVETHLHPLGKKPDTIRNTKNHISRLFRAAEQKHLLSLVPMTPERQFHMHRKPPLIPSWKDGSFLLRRHWPNALEADVHAFEQWASQPLVEGRTARQQKRQPTLTNYQHMFESYFGYLHHILKLTDLRLDHLFDLSLIKQYVNWHINEKHHRPTRTAQSFLQKIISLTRHYRPDPVLAQHIVTFVHTIPAPHPVYHKDDSWLPLRELERIGLALWPRKTPATMRRSPHHNGRRHATRAGLSLIFRLWARIPYRSRNIREMKLHTNLYRNPDGQWRIRFEAHELKIAIRKGQPNRFDVPFPPELVEVLESYLSLWRPLLEPLRHAPEVFLTEIGTRYSNTHFLNKTKGHVYAYTGRHWHPHIVRTVWASEWISSSGDFMTAAIMLNDRLETVIARYSHLRDENVAEKAYQWVQQRVNHH